MWKHVTSAFTGPTFKKILTKITNKAVVIPFVYSIVLTAIFAVVYASVGYNKLFETTDANRHKNIENSITGSLMLQSTSMGTVIPKNSLGNWLMTVQVTLAWLWFTSIIYMFSTGSS
jgi:hypothetical protein